MNIWVILAIVVAIVVITSLGLYFGGVFGNKFGNQESAPVAVGNTAQGPPPALTGASVEALGTFGISPWNANAKFVAPNAFWIWNSKTATQDATINVPVTFMNQYWNATNAPIDATLHVIVDNNATINLNGKDVGKVEGGWGNANYPKIQVSLQPGNNLFKIIATNTGGPAGLLAALTDATGKVLLQTDKTWVTA